MASAFKVPSGRSTRRVAAAWRTEDAAATPSTLRAVAGSTSPRTNAGTFSVTWGTVPLTARCPAAAEAVATATGAGPAGTAAAGKSRPPPRRVQRASTLTSLHVLTGTLPPRRLHSHRGRRCATSRDWRVQPSEAAHKILRTWHPASTAALTQRGNALQPIHIYTHE
jgi:hypothetical protein